MTSLAEADYTVAKANYDQATSNVNDTVITTYGGVIFTNSRCYKQNGKYSKKVK